VCVSRGLPVRDDDTVHGQWHRGDARGGDTNSERKRDSLVEVGKVVKKEEGEEAVKQAEAHCVQRENDDCDSASELTVEPRESANRSPIPSLPALGQVQLFPNPRTVRTRSPEADFIPQRAREHARSSLAIQLLASTQARTHARTHSFTRKRKLSKEKAPKCSTRSIRIRSIEDSPVDRSLDIA